MSAVGLDAQLDGAPNGPSVGIDDRHVDGRSGFKTHPDLHRGDTLLDGQRPLMSDVPRAGDVERVGHERDAVQHEPAVVVASGGDIDPLLLEPPQVGASRLTGVVYGHKGARDRFAGGRVQHDTRYPPTRSVALRAGRLFCGAFPLPEVSRVAVGVDGLFLWLERPWTGECSGIHRAYAAPASGRVLCEREIPVSGTHKERVNHDIAGVLDERDLDYFTQFAITRWTARGGIQPVLPEEVVIEAEPTASLGERRIATDVPAHNRLGVTNEDVPANGRLGSAPDVQCLAKVDDKGVPYYGVVILEPAGHPIHFVPVENVALYRRSGLS